MSVSEVKRIKEFEVENAKLKRVHAELALKNVAVKERLSREL